MRDKCIVDVSQYRRWLHKQNFKGTEKKIVGTVNRATNLLGQCDPLILTLSTLVSTEMEVALFMRCLLMTILIMFKGLVHSARLKFLDVRSLCFMQVIYLVFASAIPSTEIENQTWYGFFTAQTREICTCTLSLIHPCEHSHTEDSKYFFFCSFACSLSKSTHLCSPFPSYTHSGTFLILVISVMNNKVNAPLPADILAAVLRAAI